MQELLRFLEQPLRRALANGDMAIATRVVTIQFDLAFAHAPTGDAVQNVNALREIAKIRPDPSLV